MDRAASTLSGAQIELVDMSPQSLRRRMARGKTPVGGLGATRPIGTWGQGDEPAITTANTSGGSVTLAPDCVYSLTEADNPDDGLPEITGKVQISGGNRTVVQRASSATGDFRIFHVAPGGSLGLDSLTVRGGNADGTGYADAGGGTLNDQGTLKLTGVTVRSNRAGFIGGGIWNNLGTLTMSNSTIHDNASRIGGGVPPSFKTARPPTPPTRPCPRWTSSTAPSSTTPRPTARPRKRPPLRRRRHHLHSADGGNAVAAGRIELAEHPLWQRKPRLKPHNCGQRFRGAHKHVQRG
ncbi:hypothetical protein OG900_06880 [Streptomyces sp. NBC_00433]